MREGVGVDERSGWWGCVCWERGEGGGVSSWRAVKFKQRVKTFSLACFFFSLHGGRLDLGEREEGKGREKVGGG